MSNARIAEVLDKISALAELKGERVFIGQAYQRAG